MSIGHNGHFDPPTRIKYPSHECMVCTVHVLHRVKVFLILRMPTPPL